MNSFGCHSMSAPISRLLLKNPEDAFIDQGNIDTNWVKLNYTAPPLFEQAVGEYQNFLAIFRKFEVEIQFLPQSDKAGLDSIYVRDAVIITAKGAILCSMGKSLRRSEPKAAGEYLKSLGIPILGKISGEGKLEGGDVVWLDEKTVAIGEGYRSNAEGIEQFEQLLGGLADEVISVPMPHWDGPDDVLHLMSFLSPVADELAVVYSRLMPVPFRQLLLSRGFKLIEVPDSEFGSMGCNVLAVAPRQVIMIEGNPITKSLLEKNGCEVFTYPGEEISLKGAGGPTCLTCIIERS